MGDFKRMQVWQKAHALAIQVHRVSGRIHGAAHVSLRNQLVRAAMSVPTNIVEGRAQKSEAEFCRFLRYSVASLDEIEYHLIVARDLEAMHENDFLALTAQLLVVRKQIHALLKKIQPPASSQKSRMPDAEEVLS